MPAKKKAARVGRPFQERASRSDLLGGLLDVLAVMLVVVLVVHDRLVVLASVPVMLRMMMMPAVMLGGLAVMLADHGLGRLGCRGGRGCRSRGGGRRGRRGLRCGGLGERRRREGDRNGQADSGEEGLSHKKLPFAGGGVVEMSGHWS